MKKKILIGSIGAVVILILVSFTGVVGYQTTKSNSVKVSPLFNMRSKRAIGEDTKDITCRYVGKGNILPFPKRNDNAVMVQKVIDSIRKMDDKSFEKLTTSLIKYAKKDNRLNGENPYNIIETLYLVRDSDKSIPVFDVDTKNITFLSEPFCFLKIIIIIILSFIFWCAPPLATGLVCGTRDCPKTLRKLLP